MPKLGTKLCARQKSLVSHYKFTPAKDWQQQVFERLVERRLLAVISNALRLVIMYLQIGSLAAAALAYA